jgi:tRNA modification GTPase
VSVDTIAALATAPGRGALATVRVSGPDAIGICSKLFRGRHDLSSLPGGRAVAGWISAAQDDLDEVVVTLFRAPKSYTGEDLVEVSCHGGPAAGYVLEALVQAGARPAEPGEFTKRAFLNGRIDLSQAEAVAAVIAARGRAAHRAALRLLKGQLREQLEPVYDELLSHLARMEAHIEFPDDLEEGHLRVREGYFVDGTAGDGGDVSMEIGPPTAAEVSALRSRLSRVLDRAGRSDILSNGFRCVLTGAVNVGKSSLFNRLLGRDRAIVTEEPGTTRDVLEGTLELDGIPVTLVDTAGLRMPSSRSEAEGTKRSVQEREGADLILEVRDASRPADRPANREEGPPGHGVSRDDATDGVDDTGAGPRRILLLNKIDLGIHPSWQIGSVGDTEPAPIGGGATRGGEPGTPESRRAAVDAAAVLVERQVPRLHVSAKDGSGIRQLRNEIAKHLDEAPGEEILLSLRQREALRHAVDTLASAVRGLRAGQLPELVSFELSEAAREVGGLLGRDASDELMDAIFSQFCIGK